MPRLRRETNFLPLPPRVIMVRMGENQNSKKQTASSAERQRTLLVVCAVALVMLPTLYLLSIGPAIWLCDRQYISQETFKTAYAPVYWLRQWEPFAEALQPYIRLWRFGTFNPPQ